MTLISIKKLDPYVGKKELIRMCNFGILALH